MNYYVYILESVADKTKTYIGFTHDLKKWLIKHNEGGSIYTSKFKPWKIKNAFAFTDKDKALAFENIWRVIPGVLLLKNISETEKFFK